MDKCIICGCILGKYTSGPVCDVCEDELKTEDKEEVVNECD